MLKTVALLNIYFCGNRDAFFSGFFEESLKEQHLFEIKLFCNIINVFTVTYDLFNESLLNKVLISFQKKDPTPNFWKVVYVFLFLFIHFNTFLF